MIAGVQPLALDLRDVVEHSAPDAPSAVDGIDSAVAHAEIFGLLGPDGAGKTTTIGIVTTRVKPTSGTVLSHRRGRACPPVGRQAAHRRRHPTAPALSRRTCHSTDGSSACPAARRVRWPLLIAVVLLVAFVEGYPGLVIGAVVNRSRSA